MALLSKSFLIPGAQGVSADLTDRILARAAWRLIPFMSLMYVVSFLDRVNISFAALTMNRDLGFFAGCAHGFGAGIFFLGAISRSRCRRTWQLQKVGARLWMPLHLRHPGAFLSMLVAFVKDPVSFSALRFLLGAAEAGLFPGMVLYMTYWFPASTRAALHRHVPGGRAAVQCDRRADFRLALGRRRPWPARLAMDADPGRHPVAALRRGDLQWLLPDGPAKAKWLNPAEKDLIQARLADEPPGALHGFKEMLLDKRIWILMIPDFSIVIALYGLNLWQPQMIKAMGYTNIETGFIVALPWLAGDGRDGGAGLVVRSQRRARLARCLRRNAGAAGMAGAVLLTNHVAIIALPCVVRCASGAALAVQP